MTILAKTYFCRQKLFLPVRFLPRDASAERGDEIACRLSVRPSVRNVQVPCSNRLEFF